MCVCTLDGALSAPHSQSMRNTRFWVIGVATGLCACGVEDQQNAGPRLGGQTGDEFGKIIKKLQGDAPRLETDGKQASAAADELSQFSWEFYGQAGKADQNFVYSPYSLATAAAMLYAGAAGTTQSEMREVLSFSKEGDTFHQARSDLIKVLASRNIPASEEHNAQVLKSSNDFWMAERLQATDSFLNVLSAYYGAPVFTFAVGSDQVRQAINGKISDDTMGLIPELLPEDSINDDTIFVLTNALYFKANWSTQFNKTLTADEDFETLAGGAATVKMMHAEEGQGYRYADVDGVEVLSIPYFGKELEMVAMLPASGTFESFRNTLTAQTVHDLTSALADEVINLGFPMMDVSSTLPLKAELQSAGMQAAFDADKADFSPLASDDLWIGDAFHQAKIIVDEEGTEAAAATAFVGVGVSQGPPPIDLTVDRPFVFFIRDIETSAPLFVGHYIGPD